MSKRPYGVVVALILFLLVLLGAASPPGQAALKSAGFVLEVLPGVPVRPLSWVTASPVHEQVIFPHGAGAATADIYRPPRGQHPGVVVVLGFQVDLADPVLNQALEAMARLGLVVMVPQDPDLVTGAFTADQPRLYVDAFQYLQQQDMVQDGRAGFLGFSVGSSLAAIAAADPDIRSQVAFLHWFGGYYHAPDLLLAIVGQQATLDGQTTAWDPDPHVKEHLTYGLMGMVNDAGDRQLLRCIFLEGYAASPAEVAALGEEARRVYDLLRAPDPDAASAALAQFPPSMQETLWALSPSAHVGHLQAKTFVLHDTGDQFIPYGESRRFWAHLPAASRGAYTEVALFEHMTPQRAEDLGIFLHAAARLYWHLTRLLLVIFSG